MDIADLTRKISSSFAISLTWNEINSVIIVVICYSECKLMLLKKLFISNFFLLLMRSHYV